MDLTPVRDEGLAFVEGRPDAALMRGARDGARVLGDGNPRIGAHGKPVLFLHPKDFCGTLVELEQA